MVRYSSVAAGEAAAGLSSAVQTGRSGAVASWHAETRSASRTAASRKAARVEAYSKPVTGETVFLALIFVLTCNCFYLIDTDSINVAGVFNYDIIWLGLYFLYIVNLAIREHRESVHAKTPAAARIKTPAVLLILGILISTVFAGVQAYIVTGQPLIRGILPQRNYLFIMLSAFVLYRAFASGRLDIEQLFTFFMVAGAFATVLYAVQVVVGDSVTFIHALSNERYGSMRLYVDTMFSVMSGFIALWRFCRTQQIKYIPPIVLAFVFLIGISKSRLMLVSVVVAMVVGVLSSRKNADTKLFLIIAAVVALAVFLNTDYGAQVLDSFFEGIDTMDDDIRAEGKAHYLEELSESWYTWLFGCGYPSTLYAPAAAKAGFYDLIYLVDNGIYGYLYVYGFVGTAIVVALWLRMLVQSFRLVVRGRSGVYLMFVVMTFVGAFNLAGWWTSGCQTLLSVVMFCAIECEMAKAMTVDEAEVGAVPAPAWRAFPTRGGTFRARG